MKRLQDGLNGEGGSNGFEVCHQIRRLDGDEKLHQIGLNAMTFQLFKKAAPGREARRRSPLVASRAFQITLVLATSLISLSSGFAESIPSGPTAVRKGDNSLFGGMHGQTLMRGNLGLPPESLGNLGGINGAASCQAEISKIAKLTELNRLLEEKISELSKQSGKDKISLKKSE